MAPFLIPPSENTIEKSVVCSLEDGPWPWICSLQNFERQISPWRRDRLLIPVFLGFPSGSDGKESACNAEDLGSIPWLGRSPGGGHCNPLQYSCLDNPHGHRNLGGCSPWGSQRIRHDWSNLAYTHKESKKSVLWSLPSRSFQSVIHLGKQARSTGDLKRDRGSCWLIYTCS